MDIKEADVNVLEQEIKFNNDGFKLQAPFKLLVCGRSGAGKEIIYKLCVVASAWGPPNQAPNASKCVQICSLT